MVWQKIEIEYDCESCLARIKEHFEFMRGTKVKSLGHAMCPECGREYLVITEDETSEATISDCDYWD